ncbi:MAG: hypothetical protein D6767_07035 [Candidatus Hydrogenedentota bacterium]|nr:MAG: hypothetical protein D6767_07035 [Candidatus Hydrogenedentota bacterium]
MAESTLRSGANQTIPSGSTVLVQGSPVQQLVILNKGSVSISIRPVGGLEKPRRIFDLQAPATLGISSLITGSNLPYSVQTDSDCVLSGYPMNRDGLRNLIASKPNIGILAMRTMLNETTKAYNAYSPASQFLAKLKHAMDSLSLAYKKIKPEAYAEGDQNMGFEDPVISQAKTLVSRYEANGQSLPDIVNEAFLLADHSEFTENHANLVLDIDREEFSFVKRMLGLPQNIQAAIAQKDPEIFFSLAKKLIRMSEEILHEYSSVCSACDEISEAILSGDYSWVAKYGLLVDLFQQDMVTIPEQELYAITSYTYKIASEIQNTYSRLWGLDAPATDPSYLQKLASFEAKAEPVQETVVEETATAVATGTETEIAKKIFAYSELPQEKFQEYQELAKKLKSFKSPLDSDTEVRKTRRQINNLFWELYETCAVKYFQTQDTLPDWLRHFFNHALLDETLLEPEQVDFIYKNSAPNQHSEYPIHTAVEWMELIYTKKVPTSVNELGLTFFEILKQENRNAKWKRESDLPPDVDTGEARLRFEIKNMIMPNARLTYGTPTTYIAPLTKYAITMSMERALVTKARLEDEIRHLLSIDFSAFYREVLFEDEKLGINREFIQKQVFPNFILVPSAGVKSQFWQEKETRDKASPGRLNFPSLACSDLQDMLLEAVGAFRWELCKTIMGPDWNNISQPSLTSAYTDYIQFFRKNRDLSPEAKEKLAAEFKRFRDDRSRFVHDYKIWVKYESEGTQRLNKVARKILARYIPFAKPIREKLLKLPSYSDVVNKSINIRKRKANELEPRYKKYRSLNNGILPDELEETYRFYNMEY